MGKQIIEKIALEKTDDTRLNKIEKSIIIVYDDIEALHFYINNLIGYDVLYLHLEDEATEGTLKNCEKDWIHFHIEKKIKNIEFFKTLNVIGKLTLYLGCECDFEIFDLFDVIYFNNKKHISKYRETHNNIQMWRYDPNSTKCLKDLMIRLNLYNTWYDVQKYKVVKQFEKVLFVSSGPRDFEQQIVINNKEVLSINSKNYDDLIERLVNFSPDLCFLFVGSSYLFFPWYDYVANINMLSPNTTIVICCDGSNNNDPIFYKMCRRVEKVYVEDKHLKESFISNGVLATKQFVLPTIHQGKILNYNKVLDLISDFELDRQNFFKDNIDITVSIGTLNRIGSLKKAIQTAISGLGNKNFEIIVNDAGSTDGTVEWLKELFNKDNRIVTVFSGKRSSFTQAFNEVLQIARGKFITFYSDDFITLNNTLEATCCHLEKLNFMDFSAIGICNHYCGYNKSSVNYKTRADGGKLYPVIGMMYTEAMRKMGGFNSDYCFYSQDSDLSYRVMRFGGRVIEASGTKIDHVCDNDELRKTNLSRSKDAIESDKFELIRQKNYISDFMYPTILLRNADKLSSEKLVEVITNIKKIYLNSFVFAESKDKNKLNIKYHINYIRDCKTVSSKNFDVIFEISDYNNICMKYPKRNFNYRIIVYGDSK